jgi:hypothetical protein
MSRRWQIRLLRDRRTKRPTRWLIVTTTPGKPVWRERRPTFAAALQYVREALSRAAIEDVIARALAVEDPREFEAVRACLVLGDDLESKRRRIYDAGRYKGLHVRTEVEVEEDPRDTLIFIRVTPDPGIPKKGYRR